MYDGKLYAGGNFTHAGDSEAHYIAYWDFGNESWHSIIVNGVNGLDGGVADLATSENTLFVAGGFEMAGDVEVNKIARYENKTWSDLAGGVKGVNSFVSSIDLDNESLIVICGSFR